MYDRNDYLDDWAHTHVSDDSDSFRHYQPSPLIDAIGHGAWFAMDEAS